jgi:Leucine-rich repeat (LRR) protein
LIVLFFFRGHINFNQSSKAIKVTAILWILQNIMVLVSTGYRNYLYVAEYSLTYRRVGVYIWLVLTLVGLVTTFVKIYGKKSNWYLFRANGWAFYIVLVLFACQNWDLVITKFNIQKSKKLDKYYLLSMDSPAVIPELLALPAERSDIPQEVPDEFAERFTSYRSSWDDYDAPYYRPDFKEELNRKMYEFLSDYESAGWQSWNRQDEQTANKIYQLSEQGIFTSLSLKNMGLDSIRFINVFNKIEELDLSGNQIKNFDQLRSFPKLKELNLASNTLYSTGSLPNIPSLRKLYINNNYLNDFSGINRLKGLEYLNLSYNSGSLDLKLLKDLKNLKELDLSGTVVEDYSLLKDYPQLTALSVGGQPNGDFSKFPVLEKLESIDLSGNNLGTGNAGLINIFGKFTSLKKINLQNNSISTLYLLSTYYTDYRNGFAFYQKPSEVKPVFVKLEDLDVSNNSITDLEPLSYYPGLKRLDVSYNSITDIAVLSQMKDLEYLNISGTAVSTLDSVGPLDKLKELDISTSSVTNIDGIGKFKSLEIFSASGCQITNYSALKELPKLRVLQISNNYFTDISFMKDLKSLEVLYMAGNSSIQDYSALYGLQNLKVLYLDSYVDKKDKKKLQDNLPGVRIYYGYYNSYDSNY